MIQSLSVLVPALPLVSPAEHSPQGSLQCVTVGALHRFHRLPVQRHRHPSVR